MNSFLCHFHLSLPSVLILQILFCCNQLLAQENKDIEMVLPHPMITKPESLVISSNEKYVAIEQSAVEGIYFSIYEIKSHQLFCSEFVELDNGYDYYIWDVSPNGNLVRFDKKGEPAFIYRISDKKTLAFSELNEDVEWKPLESSFSTWDFKKYSITSIDDQLEIEYANGDQRIIDNSKLKVCCTSDDVLRISDDRKFLGHMKKGKITIYDLGTLESVWESPKQGQAEDFYLLEGIVVCRKVYDDGPVGLHWYDFLKKEFVFSSSDELFATVNYFGHICNYLVIGMGDPTKKDVSSVIQIDLRTGNFSYEKSGIKGWLDYTGYFNFLNDSLSQIYGEEISVFNEAHQSAFRASEMASKYYSEDGTLIDPMSPCQVDYGFFSFLKRQGDERSYVIASAYKNKVTYQETTNDLAFFGLVATKKKVLFWNGNYQDTQKSVELWITSDGQPIFISPDYYYFSLGTANSMVRFRKGERVFGFEQFDLKYNRPDIILDRLGYADSSLIAAYNKAYQKRLKKMGFTEEMLQDDFHIPEIEIENYEELATINDGGSNNLKLNLKDDRYNLDRVNVWINDVAIYGNDGISLRDKNVQEYSMNLNLELAKGNNKIQVSVLNQAGAESYKETIEIECTKGKDKPNLYLITIGASEYEQSDYNLTYAAKDAKDMASLFSKSNAYDNVYVKTLINEEVTKENILDLRAFLEQADINDEVMIFIAGHGVLDVNLDYYFATYDMDFQKPQQMGVAYEDLEGLLDGIKPLKKTLLIDACHSGEIDKEEVVLAQTETNEDGNIQFRTVGNTATPKLGVQNTSELTKLLFTDLRKGTGATVISSAGGMEFAMEGDDWNNGLFTFCLIKGIQSQEADLNNDGEIWLSELQQYVSQQVTELSNGNQQPTSRIENQTIDFRLW